MIGIGKLAISAYRLSRKVLLTTVVNIGLEKNRSKYSSPAHSLPQMPSITL